MHFYVHTNVRILQGHEGKEAQDLFSIDLPNQCHNPVFFKGILHENMSE
jgi:hypothetical protein